MSIPKGNSVNFQGITEKGFLSGREREAYPHRLEDYLEKCCFTMIWKWTTLGTGCIEKWGCGQTIFNNILNSPFIYQKWDYSWKGPEFWGIKRNCLDKIFKHLNNSYKSSLWSQEDKVGRDLRLWLVNHI